MKTGSSSQSPVVAFFLRLFTANPNLATLPPLEKARISGSRVSRPINITLFKFAMGAVSRRLDFAEFPDTFLESGLTDHSIHPLAFSLQARLSWNRSIAPL